MTETRVGVDSDVFRVPGQNQWWSAFDANYCVGARVFFFCVSDLFSSSRAGRRRKAGNMQGRRGPGMKPKQFTIKRWCRRIVEGKERQCNNHTMRPSRLAMACNVCQGRELRLSSRKMLFLRSSTREKHNNLAKCMPKKEERKHPLASRTRGNAPPNRPRKSTTIQSIRRTIAADNAVAS